MFVKDRVKIKCEKTFAQKGGDFMEKKCANLFVDMIKAAEKTKISIPF